MKFLTLIFVALINATYASFDPCNLPDGGYLPGWGCEEEARNSQSQNHQDVRMTSVSLPTPKKSWSLDGVTLINNDKNFIFKFKHYGHFIDKSAEQILVYYNSQASVKSFSYWEIRKNHFAVISNEFSKYDVIGELIKLTDDCYQISIPVFAGKACNFKSK